MCFFKEWEGFGELFSVEITSGKKHKLAFLMHWVPLLEALQPPASRGRIMAHLSVGASDVEDRQYAMTRDGWQLQRLQRQRWQADTGVRHGTHMSLLPQCTSHCSLVHTPGPIIVFICFLFFSYSLYYPPRLATPFLKSPKWRSLKLQLQSLNIFLF